MLVSWGQRRRLQSLTAINLFNFQDQQKELQRQIQTQQDQLKQNEDKLARQQLILSNYDKMRVPFPYAQVAPMVPQVPMLPLGGVSVGASPYLPMGGLQPMYTAYPTAMGQPNLTPVVSSLGVPPVTSQPPP